MPSVSVKKMIKIQNDCCGCASGAYPCMGDSCPLRKVEHYYCDKCGHEIYIEEVYEVDGNHYCEECLKEVCKVRW